MQSRACVLLVAILLTFSAPAGSQTIDDADGDGITNACECGDASGDGRLTTLDARLIQRCSVGQFPCPGLCDVNGDGRCSTIDARLIQRFAVGALSKRDLRCVARPAGVAPQECLAALPRIRIDLPDPGEVVGQVPTPVVGEIRHRSPITSAAVNGAPLDVSSQALVPGDGQTSEDEYVLPVDIALDGTDLALEIAGQTPGSGTFDPGSNRLIVSARDEQSKQAFLTRPFAVENATPAGPVLAATEAAARLAPPGSEVENALVFGVHPAALNRALQSACDELAAPLIEDYLRNKILDKVCEGGENGGDACESNADCADPGTCVLEPRPSFAWSKTLLDTETHCDPSVTLGIDFENTRLDSLECFAEFEPGLLTLNLRPRIRALSMTARGECGICVDIGSETLESVAVGVDLEVGLDLPTIRISLRDWQNTEPIDPDDPAYLRFIADSLTTPAVETARVTEARVRSFLSHPLSSTINDALLRLLVEDPDLRQQIDAQLNPSYESAEFLRRWASEWVAGFAQTKVEEKLQSLACDGGDADGEPCKNDSECQVGGTCAPEVDPEVVDRIQDQFALDSFRTNPDGVGISVKGKLSPALLDPEVQTTPGAPRTPATPPRVGDPGVETSFLVIADDAFDQLFASMTALGDVKQKCTQPIHEQTPSTVGELLTRAGCDADSTSPGNGICVGIQGGNCDAFAASVDRGVCEGARGGDCSRFGALTDPVARSSCEATPDLNLSGDMPVLYCGRADVPPYLLIQDDVDPENGQPVTTPDQIETHIRLNDLLIAVVVDRNRDGLSEPLASLHDCANPTADPSGDCQLAASCLDLNLPTNLVLATRDDGGAAIEVAIQGFAGTESTRCAGGASTGVNDPFGTEDALRELVEDLIDEFDGKVPSLLPALPIPLTDPRLIAIRTTESRPGFDDYLGLAAATSGELDLCGNGTCDAEEECGYENPTSCARDCGLCEPSAACNASRDCDTDRCVANVCQSPVFAELDGLGCDGDCLVGGDCLGGLCNLGVCTPPSSLPALFPCSTGRACRNGSCTRGLCAQICGDAFCDGTEQCGANDSTLFQCRSDCGQCPDGEACFDDAMCQSGVCNAVVCVSPLANGSLCTKDAACLSGVCNVGICTARNSRPALSPCTTAAACQSEVCTGSPGICAQICGDGFCDGTELCGADNDGLSCRADCGRCPNGTLCVSDAACRSGNCKAGRCSPPCTTAGGGCLLDSSCCSGKCSLLKCQ